MKDIGKKISRKDTKLKLIFLGLSLVVFFVIICSKSTFKQEYDYIETNISKQEVRDLSYLDENLSESDISSASLTADGSEAQVTLFTERFELIDGQYAYIAIPSNLNGEETAKVVIFSHGSGSEVTNDIGDPFVRGLQEYGEFFSQNDFIFLASNQHGDNWGNKNSINDITSLLEYINSEVTNIREIYLIGYSMGGLPTMNYATTFPDRVQKIALLAPTINFDEWSKDRVDKTLEIPIKIWHGTKDVNIPIYDSLSFVETMHKYGKDNVEFKELYEQNHFSIDVEYKNEILHYFLQ
ncbi:alpha/beta fold hydrolase [bacterium]|nr:MAG: alpha/beta fold hydrolase [bacterium]